MSHVAVARVSKIVTFARLKCSLEIAFVPVIELADKSVTSRQLK